MTNYYTLPAGTYYVGDPCYVCTDADWDKLVEETDCFKQPIGQRVNGNTVLAFNTKRGDGEYTDETGHTYGVDSGLIGITLADDLANKYDKLLELGNIVTFNHPFSCEAVGAALRFGHIVIDTDPGDEDEDDDHEW